jgi:dTDP-4-dehydrorhamnose 3,5-epimerase
LAGAFVIDIQPARDERGFFARTWDADAFREQGLDPAISQCSLAANSAVGTLRGLHYQAAPYPETKVVSCISGAIHDVIVDLRPDSPTFKRWFAVELSAENHRLLYVPAGMAHGYLTLQPHSKVYYQIGGKYVPESGRGVRWNDPAFGIEWPSLPSVIAQRDASYPDFGP